MFTRSACFTIGLTICIQAVTAHDPIPATFTTTDGVKIVGNYWTPIDMTTPAPVVILLHMYRSNKEAWTPLIPAPEYAGFAVLAIDLRGHGASVEPTAMNLAQRAADRDATLFNAMHEDVAAALKWLGSRSEVNLEHVALIGASVGCSVALDSAVREPRIDAVVLMTPGKNYLGVDSMAHIKRYGRRPILILSTEEELNGGAVPLAAALSPDLAASAAQRARTTPQDGVWLFAEQVDGVRIALLIAQQNKAHGTRMFGTVTGVEQHIADFTRHAVKP